MSKIAKPWKLSEEETFSSYQAWQHNMEYTLSKEAAFAPFLAEKFTWTKQTAANPCRGLTDDEGERGLKKETKVINLNTMLRYITQWTPHYLANDIEKQSVSISSVWQRIRKYYCFQQSESQFLKLSLIRQEEGERPERLYQRILAHIQDNMLCKDSTLLHDGEKVSADEEISPTVERLAVLRWLEVLDPDLPAHISRSFAHDLQTKTLKDLQPQIADALDSLLEEIKSKRITCSYSHSQAKRPNNRQRYHNQNSYSHSRSSGPKKSSPRICRICKAEGRPFNHSIATCDFMSQSEKRDLIRSFRVEADDSPQEMCEEFDELDINDQE